MKTTHVILVIAVTLLLAIGTASAVTIPTCDFNATSTEGISTLTTTFTATYSGMSPPVTYEWDFGDGSGADKLSGASVTHTYNAPGKYTVRLAVNDVGIPTTTWVSNTKTDYIWVKHPAPTVDFTIFPQATGNTPFTVTFDSTVSGFEPELSWDFGDNTSSTEADPQHIFYNTEDTYTVLNRTVTLTASNEGGETSVSKFVYVRPLAPEAAISANPTKGVKPLAVQFNDETVGFVTIYDWNFGDGTHSSEENPLHAYGNVGLYDVVLTAASPSGTDQSDAITINVTATADPIVCPTPTPTAVPTPIPTIAPVVHAPAQIGVYKDGAWYLDTNNDGVWNSPMETVKTFGAYGWKPVLGNWNGDSTGDKIGVYANGMWYLDWNGNGQWDTGTDKAYPFGTNGWLPAIGDWNADGLDEIGIYKDGYWYQDFNGNGVWDSGIDKGFSFGATGWEPVVTEK